MMTNQLVFRIIADGIVDALKEMFTKKDFLDTLGENKQFILFVSDNTSPPICSTVEDIQIAKKVVFFDKDTPDYQRLRDIIWPNFTHKLAIPVAAVIYINNLPPLQMLFLLPDPRSANNIRWCGFCGADGCKVKHVRDYANGMDHSV